jgi:transposase
MAHARRKFKDAQKQSQPGAEAVLKMFGELYRIEKHARESGMQPKERLKLRQNESVPVMDDLYQFMLTWIKSPEYLPKSLMGKAISYTLNLWKRLNEFTKDGEIEIDNNWIENKIRVVALGRKNYMFAGSHEAAQRSAMMYSFLGMCALEDINPQIWLEDVLTRINNHHINKLDELLPYNWKKLSSPNLEEINL